MKVSGGGFLIGSGGLEAAVELERVAEGGEEGEEEELGRRSISDNTGSGCRNRTGLRGGLVVGGGGGGGSEDWIWCRPSGFWSWGGISGCHRSFLCLPWLD